MHLSTFLTLAATASSFAVSPAVARLDRRSSTHRGVDHHNLTKRLASPEPFRVFAKDGSSAPLLEREGVIALRQKRDGGDDLIEKIGDVVQEVAVAWKLALPEDSAHVLAATTSTSTEDADAAAAAASASAAAAAQKKKQEEEAAAKAKAEEEKKLQEKLAAKAKALAVKKQKAAAKAAAEKKAQEEAEAKAKAEAAAKQAAAEAAAAAQKKAEQVAARKKAREEAAAKKKAQEEAAAAAAAKAAAEKKAADEAAAKKAAAAAASKKVAKIDGTKLAAVKVASTSKVANIGNAVSLIGYSADNCGASGASDEFPNGSQDWLNCGISKAKASSGWTPPNGVTLDRITTVSLEHALATNSVWEPCGKYVDVFDKVAKETGLPAILLASFALQESTCNASIMGGGGEVGLMQITPDKCGGRSAAACRDPEFNVRTAANYFKQELDNQGGQFLKALGAYNGWQAGMSYSSATAAQYSGCCTCQNNLDYLFQMTNGWLVGKTGYQLGSYHNLKVCGYQA